LKSYKIAHFADIHWRGLSRHDEYRNVFSQAFKQLKKENVDAIVIAGDIVHTKTQGISPEIIECLTWWFKSMAEIAPTYICLGNHDGLIHNQDRQDAISPLIEALGIDNLILMKKSGNFPSHMQGVRFVNFSCFDEEGWENISRKGDTLIALYHGSLRGAVTDSDFPTDGDNDLDLFKGCHFGMFGDIHKFQFLDKEKRFAYPGSTIQQNFGETQDKGYLLWEIFDNDNFKVERKLLKTPHPFITIDWKGSVEETIDSIDTSLKGARFRIAAEKNLLQEEIKQLTAYLKESLNSHEIVWKWGTETSSSKFTEKLETTRMSLRDAETHRSLLSSFLKGDPDIEKYTETIKQILSGISSEDEVIRNQKWTLDKLEWDNTFSYGKGNSIDFNQLTGVVGLFGRNRIGKSSIPGTLMYSLFNTTDRGSLKSQHVVNTRKDYCLASVNFSVNGIPYKAERQTTKHSNKKGHVFSSTNLNLLKLDEQGDLQSDLSGEQRKDSEKILRKLVGSPEDFLITSFAAQGEMNNFIREKATFRKNLLSRFLDLHVLDAIHAKLKEEHVSLKAILRSMPERNFRNLRNEYQQISMDADAKLSDYNAKLFVLEKEVESIRSILKNTPEKKGYTRSEVDEMLNKLRLMEAKLSHEQNNQISMQESSQEVSKKLASIEKIRNIFPIVEMNAKIREHENLVKNEINSRHQLDREKIILGNQEKSVSKLSEVPCGESFPTCKFIKDSIKDKKLIEDQRKKLEELKETIKQITDTIKSNEIEDVIEKVKKYNDAISREKTLASEKIALDAKYKLSISNVERILTMISEIKQEIQIAQENISDSPDAEIASNSRRRLAQAEDELKSTRASITNVTSQKAVMQEKLRVLNEEEARFNDVTGKKDFYDKLLSAYGKDGIPMLIVRDELPRINGEIAKILQGVTGFTITLETDESGSDLDVFLDYGDSRRPVELGSGMEKMLSSLAIRVALINISSLPKSDILIIDEGFGALDEQNVEACNKLLHSLKRFFKTILVISHVDAIKDAVDGFIEITTQGPDAHVSAIDSIPNS